MKIHYILILIGYINTIIGGCSNTEGGKMAFTIIGAGFLILGLILYIANVIK